MSKYEDKIQELTQQHQPQASSTLNAALFTLLQAVTFQGPPKYANNIRWIGTEEGVAPNETWSSAASSQDYGAGDKQGEVFVPAEADTCIRTADCCAPVLSGLGQCWFTALTVCHAGRCTIHRFRLCRVLGMVRSPVNENE